MSRNCDAPGARLGPICSPRCRFERVVVVGGADGQYGATDRVYHDHAAYERTLTASIVRLSTALTLLLAARPVDQTGIVRTGCLTVDLLADEVSVDGERVHLAPREWEVLALLARHPGAVRRWTEFEPRLWRGRYVPRTLAQARQIVYLLRARLGKAGRLIEAAPEHGYRLRITTPAEAR